MPFAAAPVIASSANKRKRSTCSEDGDGDDNSHAVKSLRRSFPDLTEDMLGLEEHGHDPRNFSHTDTVDHIMRNHSGIGVKILKIELEDISFRKLDSWLHAAVKPGIVDITIDKSEDYKGYKFPCSLFSEGVRNSIRILDLGFCAFHPTAELGTLKSLTSLCLFRVRIEGNELECLLSNCPALEKLDLTHCDKIICLKTSFVLERLTCLKVSECRRLRVIENQAPNLSSLHISGNIIIEGASQVKNLICLSHSKGFCYALTELPSIMPNLETLHIESGAKLNMGHQKHESVLEHSSPCKQMARHQHCSLKSVKVTGFSSAKSLVELTCYIFKNAVSLECLTLNTLPYYEVGCPSGNHKCCFSSEKNSLTETLRALVAIRTYIEDKVPTRVNCCEALQPVRWCVRLGGLNACR